MEMEEMVVEILVQEKVQNLSGNARKSLVGILTAIVLRSSEEDVHISTARELVQQSSKHSMTLMEDLVARLPNLPVLLRRQLSATRCIVVEDAVFVSAGGRIVVFQRRDSGAAAAAATKHLVCHPEIDPSPLGSAKFPLARANALNAESRIKL
ncbi:hypothetical protein ANCDUO_06029 [Ancylostoma duodenale]|uniref:Uncharacterized protein n=1 Tax=Ancylostoma duodenale TaxID=51022 RepID=A0A0C2DM29_9BILA|nr:hypothetical protein ANCDUO_06029 [Ancylostoma duodenale]